MIAVVSPSPRVLPFLVSLYVFALATSMSLMEISSTLLIVFCLYSLVVGKMRFPPWKEIPFWKPMGVFAVVAVLGILASQTTLKEKLYDLGRMRFFILYLFVFLALRALSPSQRWIKVLFWTTFVVSLYGFVQHFVAIDLLRPEGKKVLMYAMQDAKIGPLVVGTFNHHLTFSNVYLLFACLFFSLGLSGKHISFFSLGCFLFLLVCWTHSRMAWVAVPICVVLAVGLLRGVKSSLVAIALGTLAMGVVWSSSASLRSRFQETFGTSQQLSYVPRARLWHAQWEMFKEHPFLGVGWNTNERKAKEYVDRLYPEQKEQGFYGHAHSMVLQILSTTGLLGLSAFLWLWAEIFFSLWQLGRQTRGGTQALAVGLWTAFVGFWIQGLTQWNFGDAEVVHSVVFFWAAAAIIKTERMHTESTLH